MNPTLQLVGDRGLNVQVGDGIDEVTSARVRSLLKRIEASRIAGIVDLVATFRSLYIAYDPLQTDVELLIAAVRNACRLGVVIGRERARLLEVPVLYGAEHHQELAQVADMAGTSVDEVIRAHSAPDYLVYMNGSGGGAAFIKMPPLLAGIPRKRTPALNVPAGAVVLAAGVGTVFKASPGPTGWYASGKCPLKQWLPRKEPPLLILAGDYIRYRRIDQSEYDAIARLVERDEYIHRWERYETPGLPTEGSDE
jgi:KipI family sensor histidine kinase inhibitor